MIEKIKAYYEQANIMPNLLNRKIEMFEKHQDIAAEFVCWIETKTYKDGSCVCVEGYTAKQLSEQSPYLVGEASFALLIELREKPEKAKQRIAGGFKVK